MRQERILESLAAIVVVVCVVAVVAFEYFIWESEFYEHGAVAARRE